MIEFTGRSSGELRIGANVRVTLMGISGGKVRLGVETAPSVAVTLFEDASGAVCGRKIRERPRISGNSAAASGVPSQDENLESTAEQD